MNKTPITPEVGMGATAGFGSDCYPYTVIEIVSPKKIVVQADDAVMNTKGEYYGNQVWDITSNPHGGKNTYTLRKNGRWVMVGCELNSTVNLSLGHRHRYEDPHF